ncbi:hypothetical protein AAKU67_002478 [Oxalobacteraceae bacterium GrIS 2.11]
MQDPKLIDKNGKPVAVGDIVRIVKLSQDFLDNFSEQDQAILVSMIGQFFKIYGIDEYGQPWVSKEWHDEIGQPQTHIIALDPDEMERV